MARPLPNYLPTLDGWRAVAVLLVIWHHMMAGLIPGEAEYWAHPARWGAFGVDIFFGISGLLITSRLLAECRQNGAISLRAFYIRRAFRILPPAYLLIGVTAFCGLTAGPLDVLGSLFFFRNYLPVGVGARETQHLWSLAVEEHFYFLWPAALVFFYLKRGPRAVAWTAVGFALWRIAWLSYQQESGITPTILPHFRTDLRLDALLWGCAVAFVLEDEELRAKLERFVGGRGLWVGVAAMVLCIVIYSHLTGIYLAILIPLVLSGTVLRPESVLGRFLEIPAIAWVGRMSYSLYLWQQIFLPAAWEGPVSGWRVAPWNLFCILACASASYYLVERPLSNWGRRLSRAGGGPSSAASVLRPKLGV
ncbi:MAG: acyltransferase [Bryobacteraceae bacterium]